MKLLAGLFVAALVLPAWAADKLTIVTVDGSSYVEIQDARVVSGGRVVLVLPEGGATVPADKLPKKFLDSWGITPEKIAESRSALKHEAEESLNHAIRLGNFRKVEGVVYDLRKAQTGWVEFRRAKILQIAGGGALLDPTAGEGGAMPIYIRNLPPVYTDGQIIAVRAKDTGPFHVGDKTIRGYDAGHICTRDDIPETMLKEGLASATVPGEANSPETPPSSLPMTVDGVRLRGIGSGFFVSKDGYLLTNHHVVRDAQKIEVKYGNRVYPARVVADDTENDLAVLKVQGEGFKPLALSRKLTVDLGQEVFTIGFPNIQMQGVEPKYTDGKISSLAGMQDDPSQYQISVPVQPGNSGGPLCDARGDVVGIVVARLNDLAVLETSGVVPQNVNYAVKARPAAELLRKVKGLMPAQSAELKPANPVKTVEDGIVMILIY